MKKSEFNGSAWGIFGWNLLISIAAMLLIFPVCFVYPKYLKWYYSHMKIDGKQLEFDFDGPWWGLLGWILFSMITFGIGAFYATKKIAQFIISNVHIVGESKGVSDFDGSAWGILAWGLVGEFALALFIFPYCFVIVLINKWANKHTRINGSQLTFDYDGAWWGFLGWMLFSFVTLGIGAWYAEKKQIQWSVANTHFLG